MKEISVEQKTYIRKWEAIDGTQFNSREDCEKYEEGDPRSLLEEPYFGFKRRNEK